MDAADRAEVVEQAERDAAISRARTAMPAPIGQGRTDCVDCAETITEARRAAIPGVALVDCQHLAERRQRRPGLQP